MILVMILATAVGGAPCANNVCQVQRVQIQKQVAVAPVIKQEVIATPYVEQVRIVPLVDPYAYNGAYAQLVGVRQRYGQFQQQAVEQLETENAKLRGDVSELVAAIDRLSAKVDQLSGNTPVPPPDGMAPPQPPGTTPPAPEPTAPIPNADGIIPPDAALMQLFTERCAACHTGGSAKGKFTLFTARDTLAPLKGTDFTRMDLKLYSGEMPPPAAEGGGDPLTNEDYSAFRAWYAQNSSIVKSGQ